MSVSLVSPRHAVFSRLGESRRSVGGLGIGFVSSVTPSDLDAQSRNFSLAANHAHKGEEGKFLTTPRVFLGEFLPRSINTERRARVEHALRGVSPVSRVLRYPIFFLFRSSRCTNGHTCIQAKINTTQLTCWFSGILIFKFNNSQSHQS